MASTLDQCDQIWRNFAKTLKVFGYFLWVYFVFCKFLILIRHIFRILDKFSLLLMPQYWKDNLAIWSFQSWWSRSWAILLEHFSAWLWPPLLTTSFDYASVVPHSSNTSSQPRAASGLERRQVNKSLLRFSFFLLSNPFPALSRIWDDGNSFFCGKSFPWKVSSKTSKCLWDDCLDHSAISPTLKYRLFFAQFVLFD